MFDEKGSEELKALVKLNKKSESEHKEHSHG